jgi:hypothetical protein
VGFWLVFEEVGTEESIFERGDLITEALTVGDDGKRAEGWE